MYTEHDFVYISEECVYAVDMSFDAERPYQELPDLPPPTKLNTDTIFRSVIAASRELASLNMACQRMPDPTLLINLTPLIEAQASSEIENIVTTNDELFRAASGALTELSPPIKEALRYREALRVGFDSLDERPLSLQTALAVCSALQGSEARVRDQPGTYIGNPATGTRIYTPPEGRDLLMERLTAWERFIHEPDALDPLIVMALQHYQFEAIHPFFDGNGRTGRIINLLCLHQLGLLELPVLYLSGYLVRHKDRYYELLRAVTEEAAWEDWVLFMVDAVAATARSALKLIDTVLAHRDMLETTIRELHSNFHAAELARILTRQPYARIDDVVDAGLAQRQTASKWLRTLAEDGLIQKERVGRSVIFVNSSLLRALFDTELVAD